jgi:hypothetical protein
MLGDVGVVTLNNTGRWTCDDCGWLEPAGNGKGLGFSAVEPRPSPSPALR